jgi:2'-5' RNA ligase
MPHVPEPARLFLALWPANATREAIVACRQARPWPETAAIVAPEKLHMTLHFIGDVRRERIARVADGLDVRIEPFELALDRVEIWPNGIAALRPIDAPVRLLQLHAALRDALQRLELPTETRTFRPHVTLARRAADALPQVLDEPVRWRVRCYALVESRLGAGGGYVVLRRYA